MFSILLIMVLSLTGSVHQQTVLNPWGVLNLTPGTVDEVKGKAIILGDPRLRIYQEWMQIPEAPIPHKEGTRKI